MIAGEGNDCVHFDFMPIENIQSGFLNLEMSFVESPLCLNLVVLVIPLLQEEPRAEHKLLLPDQIDMQYNDRPKWLNYF